MERHDGHDELTARLAGLDPAAGIAPLTDGALERVTRHAMTPAPKPWTWERYRLATIGALVGSGTIVVAGILGIQALAPELPVLALGNATHTTGKVPGAAGQGISGMMMPYLSYDFTVSPTLSSSQGSPVSYRLVSSVDAATAAAQLARLFGVDGDVTMPSDGYYQVGPDDGPNVTTWTSDGVVGWSYESATSSWTTATPSDPSSTDTTTTTTQPDTTLPSDTQASSDAVALLVSAGIDASSLGTPTVDSSSGTEVDVTVPLVVDGYATDQSFYVAYGHNDVLLDAGGNLATPTAESNYPTISPESAVNVLITDHGFVYYGGIEPMAMSPLAGASSSASGSSGLGAPAAGVSPGSSDPSGTTDTTVPGDVPTTTDGPPVINVEIDQATMQLGTYTLADGTTWLLATWALSGPESGATVTEPATYSANVLAVDPTYVQLAPRMIAY